MVKSEQKRQELLNTLNHTFEVFDRVLQGRQYDLKAREMGIVQSVSEGIAHIQGLPRVKPNELIRLPLNKQGFAFNLDEEEVGIVLLDKSEGISAGSEVYRTGRFLDVPVGEELLGRIIDPLGRPLDDQGPLGTKKRSPIEREAPPIMARAPVNVPLQTGLQVVDALIPIGRGQRELILGDRQTGKTAIALDTIMNQKESEVKCIYCAIGQRSSSVAKLIDVLRKYQALDYCVVIFATGEDTPGLNFIAPYAATAVAEYFMHQGSDALIIYDDLTRHARAYRELSLLLRRPPAREAYPGDIFYIHSRLLERATHLGQEHGGGSLTALPIIETQAQNLSAYIPTNLISITDGQIYLSPGFHQRGILPAVDVGKSVSRVGGKTQLPAYRTVAGDLRLSYAQFEELESFARFGTKLDEHTQKILVRGRRIREILKQSQYQPMSVPEQICVLLSVTEGLLDDLPLDKIDHVKREIRKAVREQPRMTGIAQRIQSGQKLSEDDHEALLEIAAQSIRAYLAEDKNEVPGNLTKKD